MCDFNLRHLPPRYRFNTLLLLLLLLLLLHGARRRCRLVRD
jgi:hypothetical protein